MTRPLSAAAAVAATALAVAAGAAAQHGPTTGHLIGTGAFGEVDLVGKVRMHDVEPGAISDVGSLGNFAYLGRFDTAACAGPEGGTVDGGVYVIDISNPAAPKEVGFIPAHQDTFVGEGVQALHVDTAKFDGDLLVHNNEGCGKNFKAGVSIWDVTNPLRPVKLSENLGDFTTGDTDMRNSPHKANQIHSSFAWDAGAQAFVVMVDDEEGKDVDILDITNPRKPVLIAEYDLNQFDVAQPEIGLTDSFLHDMVVKKIGRRFIMLLSYWDGGYVKLDVTDPANAVFLGDTDFTDPDPQRAEHGDTVHPEGNAHQAEFSFDNKLFLGTDEDFNAFNLRDNRFTFNGTQHPGVEGSFTRPIFFEPNHTLTGRVVWTGGLGCTPSALPPAPTSDSIALIQRGVCFFSDKAESARARGYKAFIVANDAARGDALVRMAAAVEGLTSNIPGFFVGFSTGQAMKGAGVGVPGGAIVAEGVFDAWGYVHLFDANTLKELDTYAIPESQDPAFGRGFGDLSVHEVATDPSRNVAYFSYYAGGFRVAEFSKTGGIREVGGYLDPKGNNFWGVEVHITPSGDKLVLASDRDSGLWIFRVG
jgi:hypothetical protein